MRQVRIALVTAVLVVGGGLRQRAGAQPPGAGKAKPADSTASTRPGRTQPPEELSPARRRDLAARYKQASRQGWAFYKQRRHAEAAVHYERALALARRLFGEDATQTALLLHNLAFQFSKLGNYAKAEPLYLRSLEIKEAKLGKGHLKVARGLSSLAELYQLVGQYAKAESFYLRSLEIREAKLGKDHLDVARNLSDLGKVYGLMDEYAKAERLHLRSLEIREAKLGKNHPDVAMSLGNLGGVYHSAGEYAKAERLHLRCLEIRKAKLGKDHLDVAWSLAALGRVYRSAGVYAKAERLHLRSLEIRKAKLGKDHPHVAWSLEDLGRVYRSAGAYAKAESLYLRSLEIRKANLGKDHPHVATSLNHLAGLYGSMGAYAKAEPLYLRSLEIMEAKLGKDHPRVAPYLNNLAVLYGSVGQYAKAEPLYLRSLAIMEAKLGKDHPEVATILNNLARLYERMDDCAKAERLQLRSLAIREVKLGKDHPHVALVLNSLAMLYARAGAYAKAERLYLRCLAIQEAKLSEDHVDVALSLNNLAKLYGTMGEYAKAEPLARRAMAVLLRARARARHSALSRASFHGMYANTGDFAVSLALTLGKSVDALELLERNRALGLRELLAEAKARTSGVLDEAGSTRISAALARINALHSALGRQASKGGSTKSLRDDIERAERDYDRILVELGAKHRQFVAVESSRGITSRQIVRSPAMDDATAIIGWVCGERKHWAYVIRPAGVKWVELSEGLSCRWPLRGGRRTFSASQPDGQARLSGADLHNMYQTWVQPLTKHLRDVRKLIVIAQMWSAELPVGVLLAEKPADGLDMARWPWLASKYQISYAPSCTTLDILCRQREEQKGKTWPKTLLAMGDPPFNDVQLAAMKSEAGQPPGQALAMATDAADGTRAVSRLLGLDMNAAPQRLPGTRRETRLIAGLFAKDQSTLCLGPEASERRLFEAAKAGRMKQYRYIHLATHGFANSDRPEFSGLVLARAPADPGYDGVLHMREILLLRLDADLVVLSACQTGLGKQLRGEGMLGLSTAFFFAGARSIVMSLWKVPDTATALLMHRLYSNLKSGKPKAAALHEAKAWLRQLTTADLKKLGQADPSLAELTRAIGKRVHHPKGRRTEDQPRTHPYAHPFYWAGFILTGDPH